MTDKPSLFDVVAFIADLPERNLSRGQVGTIVELEDGDTAFIEFSDDQGRAYDITPIKMAQVLRLCYVPEEV